MDGYLWTLITLWNIHKIWNHYFLGKSKLVFVVSELFRMQDIIPVPIVNHGRGYNEVWADNLQTCGYVNILTNWGITSITWQLISDRYMCYVSQMQFTCFSCLCIWSVIGLILRSTNRMWERGYENIQMQEYNDRQNFRHCIFPFILHILIISHCPICKNFPEKCLFW